MAMRWSRGVESKGDAQAEDGLAGDVDEGVGVEDLEGGEGTARGEREDELDGYGEECGG